MSFRVEVISDGFVPPVVYVCKMFIESCFKTSFCFTYILLIAFFACQQIYHIFAGTFVCAFAVCDFRDTQLEFVVILCQKSLLNDRKCNRKCLEQCLMMIRMGRNNVRKDGNVTKLGGKKGEKCRKA